MQESDCAKYLGSFVTPNGGVRNTIEDRRKKGWGKVAQILGILSEVNVGYHRVEVGLMLRRAILTNSLLFSAEAWSAVTEKEIKRLEVVDTALLRSLVNGHSKCPVVFHYLETGSLMLRHILTFNRLMYHHHILSRDKNETIQKIYLKQKEDSIKGDWYKLLLQDFEFIGIEINEDVIRDTPKNIYKKKIKYLVRSAAFNYYMKKKADLSKLNEVEYKSLEIQPYLTNKMFNNEEINLLYSMRSRCHPSKLNFRKFHAKNLKCTFGCDSFEDQKHNFQSCNPILSQMKSKHNGKYEDIFGKVCEQKNAISEFIKIETVRKEMKEQILPGGV